MKKKLCIILIILIPLLTYGQRWTYSSGGNAFDGKYKTSSVHGNGGEYPYTDPILVVNYFENSKNLNVYISDVGYAGCDGKKIYINFEGENEIYEFFAFTDSKREIWAIGTDSYWDNSITVHELLLKMKSFSKMNVRLKSDCNKEDYEFSLIGSKAAINFVEKEYINDQKKQEAALILAKKKEAEKIEQKKREEAEKIEQQKREEEKRIEEKKREEAERSYEFQTTGRGIFIDERNNKAYKIVAIGEQIWMAENLAYLPDVWYLSSGSFSSNRYYVKDFIIGNVSEAKNSSEFQTFGVLYNWKAAKTACPNGWHLPSDEEWTQLINYLGGGDIAGGKIKEIGYSYWSNPNLGATNESGFTALPGRYRSSDGRFDGFNLARFWTSTESLEYCAWSRTLEGNSAGVQRYELLKQDAGASVRCIKD